LDVIGTTGNCTFVSIMSDLPNRENVSQSFHLAPNNNSPTWVHHKETYGENIVYDDFIANWTASNWNPDNWTDLFAGAGAKYFVLTSKHHDGFALVG
jgi:alpha-L-fucosidase